MTIAFFIWDWLPPLSFYVLYWISVVVFLIWAIYDEFIRN